MGKLLILTKYIFLIYGSDIYETRRHIHVTYNQRGFKRACKFWLEPEIMLYDNKKGDFSSKELTEIEKLILDNKEVLLEQLAMFYRHEKVTAIRR
jgi:Domain of unknown function (DUF4160)